MESQLEFPLASESAFPSVSQLVWWSGFVSESLSESLSVYSLACLLESLLAFELESLSVSPLVSLLGSLLESRLASPSESQLALRLE